MFMRDRPVTFNICSSRTGACGSNVGNFGVVRDSDLNGGDLFRNFTVISSQDITCIIKGRLETMRSKRRMDSEESKPARTRRDVVHLER
ncbi:hypothetical protein M422DRAFT_39267 [Sphaerobolus stellatus SS14]|uniref:Uncharacterized protein n=1 Tax=Sphaerobolus stellatus (strain SS14) TaxID=990650 RepID=A0A0C9UFC9_SPHS4|nr:hypothetical protein M422DRAFT_39267 [Sphaerobolus stellatus SS14]